MAWFVTYEWAQHPGEPHKSSVILRKTHPVAWIANPPKTFSESGLSNILLFFAEISDEIVEQVARAKYCGIED